uniref:Uncharacterized protein n=1 Tax=Aegilops tauschii subsp. strangulata TaxID=200361 RepID=A0A453GRA8_AEGTS
IGGKVADSLKTWSVFTAAPKPEPSLPRRRAAPSRRGESPEPAPPPPPPAPSGWLPRLFRPAACGGGGARLSAGSSMERAGLLAPFPPRARATARVCMVSSFATELLEIRSREPSPSLHVLVVPGNPGYCWILQGLCRSPLRKPRRAGICYGDRAHFTWAEGNKQISSV